MKPDYALHDPMNSPPSPISEILVAKEAVEDPKPWAVTSYVVEYVNVLLSQCYFLHSDLPPPILYCYYTDLMTAEVNNGGFSQYLRNHSLGESDQKPMLDIVASGLQAIDAPDVAEIFRSFRIIVENDLKPDGSALRKGDGKRIRSELKKLDRRFYRFDDGPTSCRISVLHRAYILRQPNLKILPMAECNEALKALAMANPFRVERAQETKRRREEFERQDPMQWSGRRLCELAGRRFVRFTAGYHYYVDGVEVTGMSLLTEEGLCLMVELDGEALLFVANQMAPELEEIRSKGWDLWWEYLKNHPNPHDELRHYSTSKNLLARVVPPSPIWPKKRR
jgi:Domain of unknown function (DUF4375)